MNKEKLNLQSKLSNICEEVQKSVIGYFKQPYSEDVESVIDIDGNTITIFYVTSSFGMIIETREAIPERLFLFPDGKSLYEFKQSPFEFNDWYNENLKK